VENGKRQFVAMRNGGRGYIRECMRCHPVPSKLFHSIRNELEVYFAIPYNTELIQICFQSLRAWESLNRLFVNLSFENHTSAFTSPPPPPITATPKSSIENQASRKPPQSIFLVFTVSLEFTLFTSRILLLLDRASEIQVPPPRPPRCPRGIRGQSKFREYGKAQGRLPKKLQC